MGACRKCTYGVDESHASAGGESIGVVLSHAGRDGREDNGWVDMVDVVAAVTDVHHAQDDVTNARDALPGHTGDVVLETNFTHLYNIIYVLHTLKWYSIILKIMC